MTETLELAVAATSMAIQKQSVDVNQLDTAKPLTEIFQPYQTTLEKWEAKAKSLVVSDIGQKAEMQMARVARLELKEARVEMEKTRRGLVENLNLRTGKINGTAKIIRDKLESLEALLLESEQFAERYAAKVKSELKSKRESELVPLLDAPLLGDLSDLSEADFLKTLNNAVILRQAKIDAAAKLESDRKAKEEADRLERERIAAENARLKLEAEATAKRLEEERKEREAQAAKERVEREALQKRIDDERQAKFEAMHAKARAEAAEAARIAEIEVKRIQAEKAADKVKANAEFIRIEIERAEERKKVEAERLELESKARKERLDALAASEEAHRKSREANERLNAELTAKAKAEAAEKTRVESERKAQEKAARAAAAAPDAAKLKHVAIHLREMELPSFSNPLLSVQISAKLEALAVWVESQANSELL